MVHIPATQHTSHSAHDTLTPADVFTALSTVTDPELGLPITEMGLVYGVTIDAAGAVTVILTLTTVGCPLFETIHADVSAAVGTLDGVTDVDIDLTFDPPWHPGLMSQRAQAEVGLI